MPPSGGVRTSLAGMVAQLTKPPIKRNPRVDPSNGKGAPILSPSAGQAGMGLGSPNVDITQFAPVFQPSGGMFAPGYPLVPPEPEQVRTWDFPVGYNYIYTPRAYEPISFESLRSLADTHSITRLCIETRKDQIEGLDWTINPIDPENADQDALNRAAMLKKFWQKPDGYTQFGSWLRKALEDLLVIDAPAIEVRRNRGGDIIGLDVIDGASIKPLIDDTGRRPVPPAPAFEQIIHGRPWVLMEDGQRAWDDNYIYKPVFDAQLIYMPRNVRPHKYYGMSPVEQIILTVNTAIRREVQQLQWFTEGNVPQGTIDAPMNWTPDQIAQFQQWFDSMLAGNTGNRTRVWMIPPGTKYHAMLDAPIKDKFDEWLSRIVCFAFSLPPNAFVERINRACYSADTETLTENGWRYFDQIDSDEKIATFNPETGAIEYHTAVKKYVYQFSGEMIRFVTQTVDVLVTPEHKMWLRGDHADTYRKVAAADVPKYQIHFAASAKWDAPEQDTFVLPSSPFRWGRDYEPMPVKMDDWLELLGYFISEGGLSHNPKARFFTLAQVPGITADKIQDVLERLPFGFNRYPNLSKNVQRWNVHGKQLQEWLENNCGGHCHEKRIPRDFLNLGKRQLRILFDALWAGDGSWDSRENRESGYYSTTSKQLADDVQELAFKLGYSAAVSDHYEAHGNRLHCYRVSVSTRKEHSVRAGRGQTRTPSSVRNEAYTDTVYCFEVPNHLFVTRRNGKIGIHGNTAETAQQAALSEGLGPLMGWVKRLVDSVTQDRMGHKDIEFQWSLPPELDPVAQMKILSEALKDGVYSYNEVRDMLGYDPIDGGDQHILISSAGPALLKDVLNGTFTPQQPNVSSDATRPAKVPAKAPVKAKTPSKLGQDTEKAFEKVHVEPENAVPVTLPLPDEVEQADVHHESWHMVREGATTTEEPVKIADLNATQDVVDRERVARDVQRWQREGQGDFRPLVMPYAGKTYLLSGHHHTEAAKQVGITELQARVMRRA